MDLRCRFLLALPAIIWSGWFLTIAFKRWSYAGWYSRSFGPFIRLENLPRHLHATNWETPLLLATLPLTVFGAWCLLRSFHGSKFCGPPDGGQKKITPRFAREGAHCRPLSPLRVVHPARILTRWLLKRPTLYGRSRLYKFHPWLRSHFYRKIH